jgi:hypothetical protein
VNTLPEEVLGALKFLRGAPAHSGNIAGSELVKANVSAILSLTQEMSRVFKPPDDELQVLELPEDLRGDATPSYDLPSASSNAGQNKTADPEAVHTLSVDSDGWSRAAVPRGRGEYATADLDRTTTARPREKGDQLMIDWRNATKMLTSLLMSKGQAHTDPVTGEFSSISVRAVHLLIVCTLFVYTVTSHQDRCVS